jgi:DhnA family fructose-bisphosphate aldolase class Ia
VLQHPHPRRMMRAFLAVVHEGATAETAARLLVG